MHIALPQLSPNFHLVNGSSSRKSWIVFVSFISVSPKASLLGPTAGLGSDHTRPGYGPCARVPRWQGRPRGDHSPSPTCPHTKQLGGPHGLPRPLMPVIPARRSGPSRAGCWLCGLGAPHLQFHAWRVQSAFLSVNWPKSPQLSPPATPSSLLPFLRIPRRFSKSLLLSSSSGPILTHVFEL